MENIDLIVLSVLVCLAFFGFSITLLKTIWTQRKTAKKAESTKMPVH